MKKGLIAGCLLAGLALLGAGTAVGAEQKKGNCASQAVPLYFATAEQTASVTLQRQYSELFSNWLDATIADSDVEHQMGGYYFAAELTVGKPYVLWVTDSSSSMSTVADVPTYTVETYGSISMVVPVPPNTNPATYEYGNVIYTYIDADKWSGLDSGTAVHYFLVSGGKPGTTCKLHYAEATLASVLPDGVSAKPIALDMSKDGSVSRATPNGSGTCHFSAALEAGNSYVLTASPTTAGQAVSLTVVSPAESAYKAVRTTNETTRAQTLTVTPAKSGTYQLAVSTGANANLSWHLIRVGDVGFEAVSVEADGSKGFVDLVVKRHGDTAASVGWGTVSESAVAGVDYQPASGTLTWAAGDESDKTIRVSLLAPVSGQEGNGKTFAVRLVPVDCEGNLAQTTPAVARVTPVYAVPETPSPEVPAAEEEPAGRSLGVGTFEGVLTGGSDDGGADGVLALAQVSLSSLEDGTATAVLTVAGTEYPFAWQSGHLVSVRSIGGKTYTGYFDFTLPDGTVADLTDAAAAGAEASVSLYAEFGGQVRELHYAGALYRRESRLDAATLARMTPVAGTYSYALAGDGQMGAPAGNGWLSVVVTPGGDASVQGRLADGKAFELTTSANETSAGVAVPLCWSDGVTTFGGTLNLDGEGSALVWRDDRAQFGGTGSGTLSMSLEAFGGRYDGTRNFAALFRGYELAVDDAASAFDGLVLTPTADGFSAADPTVALTFDAGCGVLTGTCGEESFCAVLLPGTEGFLGFEATAPHSRSLAVEAFWTDPDNSECWAWTNTVSFALGGATGTPPARQLAAAGDTVYLPTPEEMPFAREHYEFLGWKRSDTGTVCPGGATIPAPAEDLTLTAQWKYSSAEIVVALDTTLEVTPDGEGKWTVDATKSVQGGSSLRSAAGVAAATLTASFSGKGELSFKYLLQRVWGMGGYSGSLTVTLDGTAILSQTAQSGSVTSWTTVTKAVGDGEHTLVFVFGGTSMTSGQQPAAWLDALTWLADKPRAVVTFDAGSEATVVPASASLVIGEPIGALPVPTWAGDAKTFDSWTDAKGRTVTAETVVPAAGLVLTARWATKPWLLTYASSETGVSGSLPEAAEHKGESDVKLPSGNVLTKAGRELVAWSDGNREYPAGSVYVMPNSPSTLTAVWSDTRYILSFANDDPQAIGIVPTATNVTLGTIVVLPSASALTKSGHTAVGWSDGEQLYAIGEAYEMPAADVVLTVVWKAVRTVRFENEASGASGAVPAATNVVDGTSLVLPDGGTLSLTGYVVTGWTDGVSVWAVGAVVQVTADLTLIAVWEEKGATVSFAAGSGASGTVPEAMSGAVGATISLPDAGSLVRSNYELLGWTDGEKLWLVGGAYRLGTKNVTLTAVWSRAGFGAALGRPSVAFESGTWSVDGAQITSGYATANATRSVVATVYGKGTLSFRYKSVIKTTFPTMIGTTTVGGTGVTGEGTWSMSYDTAGRHEVTIAYAQGMRDQPGSGIWLSDVVWTPACRQVTVTYDGNVISVSHEGHALASGDVLEVEADSLTLTVTGAAWRTPVCTAGGAVSSDAADASVKTFAVGTGEDVAVAFTAEAYAGGADGKMVLGGKTVDAARACAWGLANGVGEGDFAEYYDDYLLNEAPGAGGGIVLCGMDRTVDGQMTLTVGRTKDCFALNDMNGTIVILQATDLAEGFEEVAVVDIPLPATAESATVTVPMPASSAGFFKAQVK